MEHIPPCRPLHLCQLRDLRHKILLAASKLRQKNEMLAVWLVAFLLLLLDFTVSAFIMFTTSAASVEPLTRLGFAVKVAVLCPGIFRSYKHHRRLVHMRRLVSAAEG